MPIHWTTEQVLALAPDARSAKAGDKLANPRQWVSLGHDERAAWGECQGSAQKPYQTQIDLSEPAFRCSCPSRKFPCKHALGLFLLLAAQPDVFAQDAPPEWVQTWLDARTRRVEKKTRAPKPPDPTAQAKRTARREAKVVAGLEELERWLCDLVRQGLATVQGQPYSFWETPAARLVDAQAPGLARLLREMASLPASGEGWQERLLEQTGRLFLLLEGFKRIETLPTPLQADVRTLIGWTQSQDELLAEPGHRDCWSVLGRRVEQEDRLRVQRTWLWGEKSERAALVLDFAYGNQPLDVSLVPGTRVEAELVFFPSAYPLRALVKQRHAASVPLETIPGYADLMDATAAYAEALAHNPWLERFPLALRDVIPTSRDGGWTLRDAAGRLVPLAPRFEGDWHLAALSGGHPLAVFGEWDGSHLLPLSVWTQDRFVGF